MRKALALWVALAALHCNGSGTSERCDGDGDCAIAGTRCDLSQNRCVCVTDDACAADAFCNAAGVCQRRAGCAVTSDCSDGFFCDIASGACLPGASEPGVGSACGLPSHCPFGTLCTDGRCEEGCVGDGDCPLGQVCFEGFCNTGRPGETICSNSSFCPFGQSCGSDNRCGPDRRGPYCRGCTVRTSMNPNPCDDPRNFCLVNSQEFGGFTNICGVDCSLGQSCPSGYQCSNVIVLTQSVCGSTAECRCRGGEIRFSETTCSLPAPCTPTLPDGRPDPSGQRCAVAGLAACNGGEAGGPAQCVVPRGETTGNCTCRTSADCGQGGTCVEGLCCGGDVRDDPELRCVRGEDRVTGFCTCATDADCGRDSCDPSRGSCRISGVPCTPGAGDCPAIACVNGGCLIGQNCAPEQGLTCSELTGR